MNIISCSPIRWLFSKSLPTPVELTDADWSNCVACVGRAYFGPTAVRKVTSKYLIHRADVTLIVGAVEVTFASSMSATTVLVPTLVAEKVASYLPLLR